MNYLFFLLIPFLLTYLFTVLMIKFALKYNIMDIPGQRSSHVHPTPRGGGIAIYISFVLMLFFLRNYAENNFLWCLFFGVTIISGIGLIDDIKKLPIKIRFSVQIIASSIPILYGFKLNEIELPALGTINLGILSIPITLVWILWMTNLYNFMDGIDGITASEATVVSFFLFLLSLITKNHFLLLMSLIIIGSSLGFLIHNFPPAKIFMGDVGSSSLGYIFAILAIFASQNEKHYIPFFIFLLLSGTFIFDATVTLIRRIVKGERWFEAHRSHYYQRLVIAGYTHKQVTLLECGVSVLLGIVGIIYLSASEITRILIIVGSITLLTLGILAIRRLEIQKSYK